MCFFSVCHILVKKFFLTKINEIVLSRRYFVIIWYSNEHECLILAPTDLEKCPLPAMDDTDEE